MKPYEEFSEEKETIKNVSNNGRSVPIKTVDEVMEKLGVGPFQYYVFLICGISFMADAVEVSLLSFLAECLEIEWDLTTVQKSSLTSVVFIGQLFGAYFWGPFADKKVTLHCIASFIFNQCDLLWLFLFVTCSHCIHRVICVGAKASIHHRSEHHCCGRIWKRLCA
jgi:hypothetical protein